MNEAIEIYDRIIEENSDNKSEAIEFLLSGRNNAIPKLLRIGGEERSKECRFIVNEAGRLNVPEERSREEGPKRNVSFEQH